VKTLFRQIFSLAVFVCLCAVSLAQTNEHRDIIIYSTETGIGNDDVNWYWWYGEGTCPSGIARVRNSSTLVADAWVTNDFPAGVYYPYVKMMAYGSATNLLIEADAGGTVGSGYANDRDPNQYWTLLSQMTIPVATNILHLHLSKPTPIYPGSIVAVYLTTRTNLLITSDDYAQLWPTNRVEDTSVLRIGNHIYNGSFEVGTGGWSFYSNESKYMAMRDLWNGHEIAYRPQPCTSTAAGGPELLSQVFYPAPGKKHTLSFRARSDPPGGKIQGSILPAVTVPSGYGLAPQTNYTTGSVTLTTNWQTISVTGILWGYPAPAQYYANIKFPNSSIPNPCTMYVDDVRVDEGSATGTNVPVEVGLENTQLGGRYTGVPALEILGNPGVAQMEIYDGDFHKIASGQVPVPSTITLPTNCPYGPLRAVAWITNGVEAEIYFCRLRNDKPNPVMGSHAEQWWYNNQMASEVYGWNRCLSPAALFRWAFIEPTDGVWKWEDVDVDKTMQSGQTLLGVLYQNRAAWANRWYLTLTNVTGTFTVGQGVSQGTATGLISWVASPQSVTGPALQLTSVVGTFAAGGTVTSSSGSAIQVSPVFVNSPAIDRFARYASETAKHYAGKVDWWEVANEPNLDGTIPKPTGQTYNFYCEMVRQAVALMPASAHLVAGSGVNQTNDLAMIWGLLPPETRSRIEALSVHLYEDNSFRAQQFVSLNLGPEIWNDEAGVYQFSAWYGARGSWRDNGIPLLRFRDSEDFMHSWNGAVELQSWNVIQTIGGGCTKHMFYDSRCYHHYGDPTGYSAQYTEVDFQDTLKPLGCANSTLAWAIADGPRAKIATPAHSEAWRIGDWLFVRALDRNRYSIGITNETHDIWGNLSNPGVYGGRPSLFKNPDWNTVVQSLGSATVIPDTEAPVIVWCEYPKAGVDPRPVTRIRWLASDQYYTSRKFYNDVQFRVTIDGQIGKWQTGTFWEIRTPGTHTIKVEARDPAGNQSESTIQFQRSGNDNPDPPVPPDPPAPTKVSAGTSVSVERGDCKLLLAGVDTIRVNGANLRWPYTVPCSGALEIEYCAFDGSQHHLSMP
jgi:hypothetical protein